MDEDSSNYEKMLRAAGCNYQTVSAINAPESLNDMLAYKSIVLDNVFRTDLPQKFLDNLDTYVKDYGCGLICCGGEESFALGGYRDTELETLLPVDMEPRGTNESPSMAIVMVIDHVGNQESGGALFQGIGQKAQRPTYVCTVIFRHKVYYFSDDQQNVFAALLGRYEFLDFIAE